MQSTAAPNKYLVPFAQSNSGKVEIPVTTADATRASQSQGFPPLTMQPPETGGVPPQGQDFNGAMNQVARVAWWVMLGSAYTYDNAFATNVNIGGYPKGSQLLRADLAGLWLNGAENNTTNPDDATGAAANWLPGYTYGVNTVAISSPTTAVYPVAAAFKTQILTGTLTANSTIVLPAWLYDWSIVDNTARSGFTLTVKTAAGTGVAIAPGAQRLRGDGTNVVQVSESVAPATLGTQAAQLAQMPGIVGTLRNGRLNVVAATATTTFTADQLVVGTAINGTPFLLPSFNKTINLSTTGAGGMDTGTAPVNGYVGLYAIYNPTTGVSALLGVNAATLLPLVYGGANMPAGYTASALIGVYATNSSGQFAPVYQVDRKFFFAAKSVLTTSTPTVFTNLNIAGAVPANAKSFGGSGAAAAGANGIVELDIAGSTAGIGQVTIGVLTTTSSVPAGAAPFADVPIVVTQQLSYQLLITNGPVSANILISSYTV